jgi:integrase
MGELVAFPNLARDAVSSRRASSAPPPRAGAGVHRKPEGPLVAYVDRYVEGRRRRNEINRLTAKNQRYTLCDFARSYGNRPVERMSLADVERWLGQADYTPSAQRTRRATIKNFCRWLVRENVLRRDPCLDLGRVVQPRKFPVAFDGIEAADLIEACPDARAKLVVLLMLQGGLRCVEVARLELGDLSRGQMLVTGKGLHERSVPITRELQEALDDYLIVRGGKAGPLVQNYDHPGRGLQRTTISLYVNAWIREAVLKRYAYDGRSAHGLRRTCFTDMAEGGASPFDIQEAAGWVSVATANDYVKRRGNKLAKAMGGRHYGRRPMASLEEAG